MLKFSKTTLFIFVFSFVYLPAAQSTSVWSSDVFSPDSSDAFTIHLIALEDDAPRSITGIYLDNKTLHTVAPQELLSYSPLEYLNTHFDTLDAASLDVGFAYSSPFTETDWIIDLNASLTQQTGDAFPLTCVAFSLYCNLFFSIVDSSSYNVVSSLYAVNTPTGYMSFSMTATSAVPIPGAVWLLGSGLFSLVSMSKRKRIT